MGIYILDNLDIVGQTPREGTTTPTWNLIL